MCASAARGQKVRGDWDRATDFTPYKTYRWTKIPTPRTPTQEMEKLIHDSADVQLNARGLKKIENGEPDVLSFANNRSGQKVAMPRYVHIGDGGRRVVEWRQSFPLLVPLEETDTACPGSGAFSIHDSSGNRKTAFS